MKKKPQRGTCAICGKFGYVTRDHIPPRSLFQSPLPNDLLTVPACPECNGGSSGDDEYFRNAICMSTYRGDSRHGRSGGDKAIRSLQRSHRHREEFAEDAQSVLVKSSPDEPPRTALAFSVDVNRINAVVSRIVRGIYFVETGRVLPNSAEVLVETLESFEACDAPTEQLITRNVLLPFRDIPKKEFADGEFLYRFACPNPNSTVIACWMVFYRKLPMLCITGEPGEDLSPRAKA